MEIVGAPVGAPEFCPAFVEKNLKRMLRESETLVKLHPNVLRKFSMCCSCSITKEHLLHFDDRVWDLWLQILGGVGGDSPGLCSLSLQRSHMKAFLPSRLNEVGLRSWDRTADFAWFASVASCISQQDEDFLLRTDF